MPSIERARPWCSRGSGISFIEQAHRCSLIHGRESVGLRSQVEAPTDWRPWLRGVRERTKPDNPTDNPSLSARVFDAIECRSRLESAPYARWLAGSGGRDFVALVLPAVAACGRTCVPALRCIQ